MSDSTDLTEDTLLRYLERARSEAGDARLVLRPTMMILRPDLTDEQLAMAEALVERFSKPGDAALRDWLRWRWDHTDV